MLGGTLITVEIVKSVEVGDGLEKLGEAWSSNYKLTTIGPNP